MVADHFMPAKDVKSAELQARLKRWSEEQGVTFYDQGRAGSSTRSSARRAGSCRAVVAEAIRTPAPTGRSERSGRGSSTDIACASRSGRLAGGARPSRSSAPAGRELRDGEGRHPLRDREIGVGGGTNAVLEFVGPGRRRSRSTSVWRSRTWPSGGLETGIFVADDAVARYLEGRARSSWTAERSDPDATFGTVSTSTSQRRAGSWRAAPPEQREGGLEAAPSPSTRSTSATARTGR
jgi:3-isopropylmalate/(R)-2-methylmalate dehydratase large subunit